jgi:hypothetical protein
MLISVEWSWILVKIKDIIKRHSEEKPRDNLSPLQKKVLGFFERHKGEAFSYNDDKLYGELKEKNPATIRWSLWALERKGFLAKKKAGKKTYHGLPQDIKRLETALKKAS